MSAERRRVFVGFAVDGEELAAWLAEAFERAPLLPPSLTGALEEGAPEVGALEVGALEVGALEIRLKDFWILLPPRIPLLGASFETVEMQSCCHDR